MYAVAIFVHLSDELLSKIDTIISSLLEFKLFNLCGDLVCNCRLIGNTSVLFLLLSFKTAVTVSSKSDPFLIFPNLDEALDSFKSKNLLFVSEFTVLAQSVKADYKLHVLCHEIIELDLRPLLLFFWYPLGTASEGLFFLNGLALFPSFTLMLLGG